jgi:hypothetical protein
MQANVAISSDKNAVDVTGPHFLSGSIDPAGSHVDYRKTAATLPLAA